VRCAGPQMQLSALARREYAVRRTCTQSPHSCIAYRAPSAGAGPLPVPEHARTRVPPSRPSHCGCTRFRSGPATHGVARDDVWLYQYVLVESVPTVPSSSSPASVLASGFRVGRSEPGTGWRLPGCEKTFFGAISTCASASSQRCHVRVRLLPCAVASCCLPWCLAVMPVRGRW